MRLEDFDKKTLQRFLGLYSRGEVTEVPEGFFSDCLNVDFDKKGVKTRSGLSTSITLGYGSGNGVVRRFASFLNPNIVLILDASGNLYTYSSRTGDTATTPLITVGGATDFSAIKMLDRIYIGFHDGTSGLTGVNLKVYIPHDTVLASDVIRDAGGAAPSAAVDITAVDGAAGLVNAGVYQIAVAYVTTSGFVTPPGPKIATVFTPTSYTAPGSKKIDLSDIPTGPAGTASRQILITEAGGEEYFFLPSEFGGVIANNSGTTTTINFDDTTDLVDSADYLFDLLETIPAPLVLHSYNGRLITGGEYNGNSFHRASYAGEPEAFDSVDGIVQVNPDDGFIITNVIAMRDVLYSWKNLGVFTIRDNGDVPSTWSVNPIDESVNTSIHGIAEFFDISEIRMARDFTLVSDRSGILFFDGIVRKPPITDNINDIWQTINWSHFHKTVLTVDEQLHKIYCAITTGVATDNNKLLVGDYNMCAGKYPDLNGIKWAVWELKPGGAVKNPTEIGMIFVSGDTVPTLKMGSADGGGKIWKLDSAATTDDSTAIESYIETSLLVYEEGMVHFFTAARLRVIGSGTLLCTIKGYDSILTGSLPSTTLSATPGVEALVRFDFQNERARLKFRLTTGYFKIDKIEVFGKPIYSMRPA